MLRSSQVDPAGVRVLGPESRWGLGGKDTMVPGALKVLPAHLGTPILASASAQGALPQEDGTQGSLESFPGALTRGAAPTQPPAPQRNACSWSGWSATEKRPLHPRKSSAGLPSCGLERRGLAIPQTQAGEAGVLT